MELSGVAEMYTLDYVPLALLLFSLCLPLSLSLSALLKYNLHVLQSMNINVLIYKSYIIFSQFV